MDIGAIIDEVARRHHIRLAPDDPLLASVTMTEVLHKVFAEHLKGLVKDVADQATDRLASEIEAGRRGVAEQADAVKNEAASLVGAAKKEAASIVNAAGEWSADRFKASTADTVREIKQEVAAALTALEGTVRSAREARRVAMWSAVGAVAISAVFFGGALGFWLAGR